jgi:uncharacterized protein (TIGR03437 family)
MAVWYPSTQAATLVQYWTSISGLAAQNGAITDCGSGVRFPLVVFSHGYTGCGTQSVFLTEDLARQGYIVAAPDHADHGCSVDNMKGNPGDYNPNFGNPSAWTDQTASYRNVDIETVVNWLLANSPWADRIDTNRIAMSGHSFGGYTTFAKIGGWSSWYDPRFKVGLMFSPYIQPFTSQHLIQNPTVPQMYQGGVCDTGITPWLKGPIPGSNQPGVFQQAQFPPPNGGAKYFAELDWPSRPRQTPICFDNVKTNPASHYAFSNDICTSAVNLTTTTVQACLQNVPNARLIVNYAEAFLDRYLGGQNPSLLLSTGTGLATYWRTAAVPGGTYWTGAPTAPISIAAIKGESLAPGTNLPQGSLSMPMSLDGTNVTITDSNNISRPTPLYAISPGQINFVVPAGLAAGYYTVTVKNSEGATVATGPLSVNTVSPAFFAISPAPGQTGAGFGWGWAQQVDASGNTNYLAIFDPGAYAPIPLSVMQPTYLVLAGTGVRFSTDLQATVGGVSVPVKTQPYIYQAIDAVAIGPLPSSLTGKGQVNIVLTTQGMQSNAVAVVIQ